MENEIYLLSVTAASIGIIHTVIGIDHYVPFIALSKAGNWSKIKTIWITLLCGIGHVLSSVVIGAAGIIFGLSLFSIKALESLRGDIAAWLLLGFGFLYMVYGIWHSLKNKPHKHLHIHSHDSEKENIHYHSHDHKHSNEHAHVHHQEGKKITPWVLFIIFVFGPCEALIPVLMFPAATQSLLGIILVTTVFGIFTILTMITMVLIGLWGIELLPLHRLEKHVHSLAGLTIFLCGAGILFVGI